MIDLVLLVTPFLLYPLTECAKVFRLVFAEGVIMRKVRDYDAELKALTERAREVKAKRVQQLGELVAATGADALDIETLAGVLLDAAGSKDADAREAWRAKGAGFFQRRGRKAGRGLPVDGSAAQAKPGGDAADGSGGAANR